MLTHPNAGRTGALRPPRAGHLAGGATLLQRGLPGAGRTPPSPSTVATPPGDLGPLRSWLPAPSPHSSPGLPGAHAAPAINGLLDRLKVKLPDLPHIDPAALPGQTPSSRSA